jgi:serine/threonine protein kinase
MDDPERRSFLASLPDDPPGLREELSSLLEHSRRSASFLDRPLPERLARANGIRERPARLVAGERVGDYEILAFVARGGAGEVYRARQGSLGREVALKVLPSASFSRAQGERFLRGAREVAGVTHPHLVEVFDAGEDRERGLLFFSMRFVDGATLQERLEELVARGSPPDRVELRSIVERLREVSEAASALHRRALVHRDVKPSNVLLDRQGPEPWSGAAVLVDYGLVRSVDREDQLSTLWTTPAYSAPEVLTRGNVDARADVFAIGLCLYDILGGWLPSGRPGNPAEGLPRLARVRRGAVDAELDAVIAQAIDPIPELRYPDARSLAGDLSSWLEGRPVSARRRSWWGCAHAWVRRHPGRALRGIARGAALALLLSLVSIAVLFVRSVVEGARAVRVAWADGDLSLLIGAETVLPDWLESWVVSREASRALHSIRADDSEPISLVRRELLEHGSGKAMLLAARYLERDGLALHSFLTRFLAAAMRNGATAADRSAAVRLAARLFTDRPDYAPEELTASAPLREALEAMLEREASGDDVLCVLSALSGCGNAESLSRLASRLSTNAWANDGEMLRLLLRSLEWNLLRSQACGFARAAAAADLERLLVDARDAVLSAPLSGTVLGNPLTGALGDLFVAVAVTQRAAGIPPSTVSADRLLPDPVLLAAARRSPSFQEAPRGPPPLSLVAPAERAGRQGILSALMDEARAEREGRDLVAGLPGNPGEAFDLGLSLGREWLRGRRPNWANDEDSRLGAFFEREHDPLEEMGTARTDASRWLARWNFMAIPCEVSGTASRVATRCARQESDEVSGYLKLGTFGVSEVRMTFGLDASSETVPSFHLLWQKSTRFLLPGSGTPKLEVDLDGRIVATGITAAYLSDGEISLVLSVPSDERAREHAVAVRLLADADAPVRLYEAWVTESIPGTVAQSEPDPDAR